MAAAVTGADEQLRSSQVEDSASRVVKTDGLQVHVSPGEELLGQKTGQKTVPVSLSGEPRWWREQHFPGHGRSPPPSSLVSHFDTWARDVERCGLILSFVRLKQPLHFDHYAIIRFSLATQSAVKKVEDANTLVFTEEVKADKHQAAQAVKKL
ncbi:hypothetical protein CB1_001431018 [Camelus ferus]|nr:hypothetical protein CB1_001431018 [Camelus ferus]